jgi:hypothetical protein
MATAEFHARIQRINKKPIQRIPVAAKAATLKSKAPHKRTADGSAIGEHIVSSSVGIGIGLLIAIVNLGAVRDDSPWGPGTEISEIVSLVGSVGVLATVPMIVLGLFLRKSKPDFFFFSMAYSIAVIASLFV